MSPTKKESTTTSASASANQNRLSEPTFRNQNYFTKISTDPQTQQQQQPTSSGYYYDVNNTKRTASSDSQASNSSSTDYANEHRGRSGATAAAGNVPMPPVKRIKCVFVGDAAVGKTSLIVSYTTNGYPQEYVPTAFDNFSVLVRVDNQPVQLQICDTAGQHGFDNLRPLCYPNADVFVLCFSVVNPDSFYSLHNKWVPEIQQHCPQSRLVLVGTQSDLRTNVGTLLDLNQMGETVILESEAKEYCKEIKAVDYIECSALTQQNLKEVFDAAILTSLKLSLSNDRGQKSKVEKASRSHHHNNNSTSHVTRENNDQLGGHGRKSFKKLKDKIKRSNSVDSAKHTSVQVRRQTSNNRINQIGTGTNDISSSPLVNNAEKSTTSLINNNQKNLLTNNHHQKLTNNNNNNSNNNLNKILNLNLHTTLNVNTTNENSSNFQAKFQKFSTSSAPASDFYDASASFLMKNSPNDAANRLESYGRLKKGWKKLLCMA